MDDALRRIERAGTPLERLRARRRAGWTERAAWEDLVGVDTSLEAVRDLAAEHPDLSREGDVFAHRPSGLRLRLVPGGAVAPLLVAETPCTQAAWDALAPGIEIPDRRAWIGADLPIEGVSWVAADAWCVVAGLALPTEREWEHACRAGSTEAYCFGDDPRELPSYGWFRRTSLGGTRPVGALLPNAWGLHDMHGGVWEWCADDLEGESTLRCYRGGSWDEGADDCRCASRCAIGERYHGHGLGFRPVLRFGRA